MAGSDDHIPVLLLKGSDDVLLSTMVTDTVNRLTGDGDMPVDEFSGDDYSLSDLVMAASTVSMFGDRVVLARNVGRFPSAEVELLTAYMEAPSPDTTLVLVWEKAVAAGSRLERVPKKLTDAIAAAGGQVLTASIPGGKGRSMWVDDQIAESGVRLSRRARQAVIDQLGDDLNRLIGLLNVLSASFGDAEIDVDELDPFLGEAGSVPPWELTDAIDKGQIPVALDRLRRMMVGGERHALAVMASVRTHFDRMLRLDGAAVSGEKEAAALLGMKGSTFPAKKALAQSQRLGSKRLGRATVLLAEADAELRGRGGKPPEVVMETLVARLTALASGGRRR